MILTIMSSGLVSNVVVFFNMSGCILAQKRGKRNTFPLFTLFHFPMTPTSEEYFLSLPWKYTPAASSFDSFSPINLRTLEPGWSMGGQG